MKLPWWSVALMSLGVALPILLVLLYGLWGMSRGNRKARHDFALESNRCPHCDYDLRGTPGWCPECGREYPISLCIAHRPHRIELPDLSPDARQAIRYAVVEARQLKFGYIGTEHLLMGILRQGEGPGAKALVDAGIALEPLRADIRELIEPTLPTHPSRDDRFPVVTSRLRTVFLKLSDLANHSNALLDTEDLLVQLLADPDNTASQLVELATEEPSTAMDN